MSEPYLSCNCNLEISGLTEDATITIFETHICNNRQSLESIPPRWYECVFHPVTVFILAVGTVTVLWILYPNGL